MGAVRACVWLAPALAPASANATPGGQERCDVADLELRIAGGEPRERRLVCEGVGDAVAFFRDHGLAVPRAVDVRISERVPPAAGDTAAGCFIESENRIHLVPYAGFRRQRTWFELPIDEDMYRSLVVHEAAHAFTPCNFALARPSIHAKEYVAYVVMLGAMPPGRRERILRRYSGDGAIATERLTPLLYLFDPMRFGAFAFIHFRAPGNGMDFVRAVLEGKALVD